MTMDRVYDGFWYHAKMDALLAFNQNAQRHVTGRVTLTQGVPTHFETVAKCLRVSHGWFG